MNRITMATIAAATLLSVPAFAQTNTQTPAANNPATASQKPMTTPMTTTQARQKIMADLEHDGFTNIHVVPEAFLVHATNKQNEPVVMIINPDSVFEMTALPNQPNTTKTPTTAK